MQQVFDDILEEAKAGNKVAFKHLVEEHQQFAFNVAFRVMCNQEDAKDVVQESFIKVWKNISKFNVKMKFTTWMYKIIVNTAIDKRRSSKRTHTISIDHISEHSIQLERLHADEQLENKELGQIIASISDGLPTKQRLVFVLRDIQGLNSREVGKALDMAETSVKSNLYNARQFVKKRLSKLITNERRAI